PGRILTGLANTINAGANPLCLPVETKPGNDWDLNLFLAVYFVHGGTINREALYADRLVRPFKPVNERIFLTNPCERPFPDQTENSDPITASPLPKQAGQTDLLLAKAAGIAPETLAAYLEKRSTFLGGVIKVDLDSMSSDNQEQGERESLPAVARDTAEATNTTNNYSISLLILELIEQRTGFPLESLSLEFRLLDDLNLDSIKASELIAEAATKVGVSAAKLDISQYANATLAELVELFQGIKEVNNLDSKIDKNSPSKYPIWVRDFTVSYTPSPLLEKMPEQPDSLQEEKILLLSEHSEQKLTEHLKQHFSSSAASPKCAFFEEIRQNTEYFLEKFTTVIVLLPQQTAYQTTDNRNLTEHVIRLHTVFSNRFHNNELHNKKDKNTLVLVQFGGGFFGTNPVIANIEQCSTRALAASLHLEQPDLKIRVLDLSPHTSPDQLCAQIVAELSTTANYSAVGYDAAAVRRVPQPVLQNIAEYRPRLITWSSKDVFLVTGGAKGITAECALELARAEQVQMALIGSSPRPTKNDATNEIAKTLRRFTEAV
ncbi:MAG: hypothetical protein D3924_09460, partial [Candidatus Electrothrix sp. AR4]|nr:hypothetical protein [Candidatus Electrothrix sp. AR4]